MPATAAQPSEPDGGEEGEGGRWAAERLLATDFPPPRKWLWPFLFAGCRAMLSGGTGAGKTRWMLGCVRAVLAQEDFATFFPSDIPEPPPRILYLDYELGTQGMKEILASMAPLPPGLSVICFDDPRLGDDGFLPIDKPDGQAQITGFIRETQAGLVVIDNLYSACIDGLLGGSEVNGAHGSLTRYLKMLSRAGVATLTGHHAGKREDVAYGDSRLTWANTGHMHIMRKDHDAEGEFRVRVCSHKLRYGKALPAMDMICDVATGRWRVVDAPLTARQRWVCVTSRQLSKGTGRGSLTALRDLYFETHCKDCSYATGRVRWKRDLDACVTYLGHDGEHFWILRGF